MALKLPLPVANYFDADKSDDPIALADLFSERAIVRDEGRTYAGREAIRRWKTASAAKYNCTVEPQGSADEGGLTVVTAQVAGSFPGSPIKLRYRFELENNKIARLESVS